MVLSTPSRAMMVARIRSRWLLAALRSARDDSKKPTSITEMMTTKKRTMTSATPRDGWDDIRLIGR